MDNEPEIENLRECLDNDPVGGSELDNKILSGSFKHISVGDSWPNLIVQMLQVVQTDPKLVVRMSDGLNWVQCTMDNKYIAQIESEQLQTLDIVKIKEISGSVKEGNFHITEMCRPRSLQCKNKTMIGNPVPLVLPGFVKDRVTKSTNPVRAPRVDQLFDDLDFER